MDTLIGVVFLLGLALLIVLLILIQEWNIK